MAGGPFVTVVRGATSLLSTQRRVSNGQTVSQKKSSETPHHPSKETGRWPCILCTRTMYTSNLFFFFFWRHTAPSSFFWSIKQALAMSLCFHIRPQLSLLVATCTHALVCSLRPPTPDHAAPRLQNGNFCRPLTKDCILVVQALRHKQNKVPRFLFENK